jgi:hypothetical protein
MTELLVVIAVLGILISMLLPGLARSKERAIRAACLNNQRQLALATTMDAQDDSKGLFCLKEAHGPGGWPLLSLNWLMFRPGQALSVKSFYCPATRNGTNPKFSEVLHPPVGGPVVFDLTQPAMDRLADAGYSYDLLPWFEDMENYWNGNDNAENNSPCIPKTLSNINTYTHKQEALGLQGTQPGPAAIWLFTDNDVLTDNLFWPDRNNNHATTGANTMYTDGHGEWIRPEDFVRKYELSQDNNRSVAKKRPSL